MHCHTAETSPCGVLTATEVVDGLKEAGYAGTFITRPFLFSVFHETKNKKAGMGAAGKTAILPDTGRQKKRGDEIGIKVFLGLEVQPEDSPYEFLVYGPDEAFLMDNGPFYTLSTPDFYDLMAKNGFLVFQAHPYRFGLYPENPAYFDGIEIVNAQPRNESRNKLALQFAFDHDIMVIAGSDVHMPDDIGRSGIMLPSDIHDVKDFIEYYRRVRTPELIVTYGT